MARPNKSGLDYFPLDVHVDDKIELVEAKHGLVGFGVIIKLFQNIYKNGYYIEVSEDRLLLLSKHIGVDNNVLIDIINDGMKWKLFDQNLFEKHSILTSRGVQKRYIEATKRRKDVEFICEYMLVEDVENMYPDKVNVNISFINADINQGNDDDNEQSKVKKSKEKNTPLTPQGEKAPSFSSTAEKIYQAFIENIQPQRKSKTRAVKNIATWLSRGRSDSDLIEAFKNYSESMSNDPQYRKDPANFYGLNEDFCFDYLPKNFEHEQAKTVKFDDCRPKTKEEIQAQLEEARK